MSDYEEFQKEVQQNEKENEKLLAEFEGYLRKKGLKPKTIHNHRLNVDFYINDYLNYYDSFKAVEGTQFISGFLGDWFIRKALWSSKAFIKSSAASIKKFYTFMYEKKLISKDDLDDLKMEIKEMLPDWLEAMENYENSIEDW
ncbi:MAG: recombinase [Candidatus Cloacimonetes bacterium]|nr:recombinase [Candidatus Cloacimonadota bacterium]MCF7813205.1 recombinase [Candidatus Cloacimonadota bacterium]MCF7867404.1 recombinase [Candidatus Cloacimonadota bacterium]MCF7882964.1 recombinase [Candidatus Cloacimonadota bacterium]